MRMKKYLSHGYYSQLISQIHFDVILLTIRIFTIVIWLILLQQAKTFALNVHICFMMIIFFSDALDGIISRRFSSAKEQYYFRIADATVDKVGILLFMVLLLKLNLISIQISCVIIVYNILLVIFPIIKIIDKSQENIELIQATLCSRIYTLSVGIYFFISIISDILVPNNIGLIYFVILGFISIISHIVKIKNARI